jgi:hypothetical protein
MSSWILDSGASFHMTHESTHLGPMSSFPSPMSIKIVDGTPLPIVSHGTLHTAQFYVPFVSHVSQLHLQLFSVGQIMIVVSFLILMLVLFIIITPRPWLVLATGFVIQPVSSFHFAPLDSYC